MTARIKKIILLLLSLAALSGCASTLDVYRDANMDFSAIRTVAILPLANLTRESPAAERVRDVFSTELLATGALYVIPPGEVARGINRVAMANPSAPSTDEAIKLAGIIKADAIVTGTIKEYGEVRSGSSAANVISLSMQMIEAQTGRVVWSAATTKGGIGIGDRLLGGGGEAMNTITVQAVDEIIKKLFQ
ncbi:MAG TPA: GNA1162 family protein [Geobacteraceae bacterium]